MKDFLEFNTFITKYVLIFFYYLFTILLPVVLYYAKDYIKSRFNLKIKSIKTWIILIVLFLMAELFIRMFFEMLIGYFDMHDYLYQIDMLLRVSSHK